MSKGTAHGFAVDGDLIHQGFIVLSLVEGAIREHIFHGDHQALRCHLLYFGGVEDDHVWRLPSGYSGRVLLEECIPGETFRRKTNFRGFLGELLQQGGENRAI